MFTDGEDIALSEVLTRLHEKQAGVAVSEELLKDSDALRNSFGEVIPNFDRERVYTSDIKNFTLGTTSSSRPVSRTCRPGRSRVLGYLKESIVPPHVVIPAVWVVFDYPPLALFIYLIYLR